MKSIIERIFYSILDSREENHSIKAEEKAKQKNEYLAYEKFYETLYENQQKLFDEFDLLRGLNDCDREEQMFIFGFKACFSLFFELLDKDTSPT